MNEKEKKCLRNCQKKSGKTNKQVTYCYIVGYILRKYIKYLQALTGKSH